MIEYIVLILKPDSDNATKNIGALIREYGYQNGIPVSHFVPPDSLTMEILFISIGGDGTMLGAMRQSVKFPNSTVLGFNTGSLGFLSEELPMDIECYLDKVMNNKDVMLDKRMVAKGTLTIDGEPLEGSYKAINEFVVSGGSISDPIVTEVYINEHFVSKQMGNGVLVSTATGSTAMSLSAGGSIVSPVTNIMQIVPLVAHTLTSRPIISTGRDTITIRTSLTSRINGIEIHADGRTMEKYNHSNATTIELHVSRYRNDISIWRPDGWNFFDVLARKMKW